MDYRKDNNDLNLNQQNTDNTENTNNDFGTHQQSDDGFKQYNYSSNNGNNNFNQQQRYTPSESNGMAIASMILGIMSIVSVCCFYISWTFGALSIVLALLSRGKNKNVGSNAKAGIICSTVGIVLSIIVSIYVLFNFIQDPNSRQYLKEYGERYEEYSSEYEDYYDKFLPHNNENSPEYYEGYDSNDGVTDYYAPHDSNDGTETYEEKGILPLDATM